MYPNLSFGHYTIIRRQSGIPARQKPAVGCRYPFSKGSGRKTFAPDLFLRRRMWYNQTSFMVFWPGRAGKGETNMPNKEGGYGGYRRQPSDNNRRVRAPGAGGVRRADDAARTSGQPGRASGGGTGSIPRSDPRSAPYAPGPGGEGGRRARYDPDALGEGWVRPDPYRRPAPQGQGPGADAARARARARAARDRRRARRRLLVLLTVAGLLVVSGIVTLVLPESVTTPPSAVATAETALANRLVAPLPYAGGETSQGGQGIDWGAIGPARQTDTYTYTVAPAAPASLPEFGRVTTDWFSDAVFLGDSLTLGYLEYDIDLSGARVLAYQGASPNNFVNRTTLKNIDDVEEIPLDILAADPPAKLYLLVGTNALAGGTNDEGFLNYYGRLLDELKTILPDSMIFVQSVLPARGEALETSPGLSVEHIASINASIQSLCAEKGCYYLDLASALTDDTGALAEEYAQPDGIHLTVKGYNAWVTYLCTHVPYDKDNPYQAGSTYYLDESIRSLLADLP